MEPSEIVAAPSDTQPSSPIDDSFSMEDHQEAKKSRGGKPKLFQCTGYGDCRMVFTRSEHLARHMRKHTGEKPFKCVVPGCSRMFSRFDNMMQHTQTHNKSRGAPRRPKGSGKSKDRLGSSEQSLSDADSSYDHSGLPSPPPSRRGSEHAKQLHKTRMRRHRQLQRKNYAEDDEEDELDYADSDGDQLVHSGDSDSDTNSYHMLHTGGSSIISQQRAMFAEMRRSSRDGYALPPSVPQSYSSYGWPTSMPKTTLDYDSIWPPPPPPPPSLQAPIPLMPGTSSSSQHQQRLSESPMSSSSSTSTADSLPNTSRRPRTTPKVQFHPYPYNRRYRRHSTTDDHRYVLRPLYPKQVEDDNNHDNDTRMILPRLATYLVAHPDEPPENYLLHHPVVYGQEPLAQKRALTWPTLPGTEKAITRRLSVQDLCNPIECLERSPSTKDVNPDDKTMGKATVRIKQEEGIDLTLDEYEAIQGFGRFQKFGALK